MTPNEYVEKLYVRESELIRICNYHNLYGPDANDIIQELYIILLKHKDIDRYLLNDEPNIYIVFMIIKNLIYHFRKKENKYSFVELKDIEISEDIYENEKFEFILNEIDRTKYWFDQQILRLYILDNHSIRSLSKETKISFSVIQPIVHKFKIRCNDNYIKSKNAINTFSNRNK